MLIVARGLKAYNLDCFSIGDLNSTTASVSQFSVETLKGVGRKLINILMMGKIPQSVPIATPISKRMRFFT